MKIKKARNLGFCFGVRRAVDLARDSADKKRNIYIIGDIVHNENVTREIRQLGIKKVSSLDQVPSGANLIIKAHGVPRKIYDLARAKKIRIIDATCPMVTDIQKKAVNLESRGYQVLVIGDRKHEEVQGILGHIRSGLVIENPGQVKKTKKRIKSRIAVLCQSTQNMENVSAIIKELSLLCSEMRFLNTICRATHQRQDEVRSLARQCAAVLVIGSKKSANTTRLYHIARAINEHTFFLHSENGIDPAWKKFKSIALIGGASTPSGLIEKIMEKIHDL